VQYRGEPFAARAAHPDASPATTLFNQFSSLTTGRLTGDLGQVKFGVGFTPLLVQPQYTSAGTHFDKVVQSHASGRFIAGNGNPVPQAGKFYNGADLDRGPSDLTLNHTLLLHGMARLPWKCEVSAIFRAQSGFHFTDSALAPADVDGDGLRNGVDFLTGRNHFQAPGYDNLDTRFSKRLTISDRLRIQAILEFFNLLNRANPAAVEQFQNVVSTPLGKPLQYLPGREGQAGLRVEF